MTRAQRMHRRLVETICARAFFKGVWCMTEGCIEQENLEIDHPNGRRRAHRNRNPEHRRKSALQRVRELWEAFASDEPLRVLCRSCNAREGGGRRYA
jgi:hypothetical protein